MQCPALPQYQPSCQQASTLSKFIVGNMECIWTMWELEDLNKCKLGISKSKNLSWSAQKYLGSFVRERVELQLRVKQLEARTFYDMPWKAFQSWKKHYYYWKAGKKEVHTFFFNLKKTSVLCRNGDSRHLTIKKVPSCISHELGVSHVLYVGDWVAGCPGFGQDRVNFLPDSRKGHSRAAWPHLAKQSRVFHTMCRHAGFWWGGAGRRELTHGLGAWHQSSPGERGSVGCAICVVFSPYLYHCCSCSLCLLFC